VDAKPLLTDIADLRKIIESKKALGRDKDNEQAELELIRRLLSKPMNKRTHFLRKKTPGGGSHL